MSTALYTIRTWDGEADDFTEQAGLSVPSKNVPWLTLLQVMRELRNCGFMCHYKRSADGDHEANDPMVLVERVSE